MTDYARARVSACERTNAIGFVRETGETNS